MEQMLTNKNNAVHLSLKNILNTVFVNFFKHNVGKNAAALAYYLLFALFPLLFLISNLFGLLNFDIHSVANALQQFLPDEIIGIVENYLYHISNNSDKTLIWFSLIFLIWFPTRASKGLMEDVRLAYNLPKPENPAKHVMRQFLYTIVLLLVIVITLLLAFLGENAIRYLTEIFNVNTVNLNDSFLKAWQYIRFLPVSFLMFAAIGMLYSVSLEHKQPFRTLLPGVFVSLISWLVVSIVFSYYVEKNSFYNVIYGTLGAVIILLIWLYLTSIILIMGAEINAAIKNNIETTT